jgi:hypothetical protein
MSNLSNLYISASYKGIINLADSTNDITNQTNTELQDGEGNGIGISVLSGSLFVENEISSSTINGIGNLSEFSQSVDNRLDQLEADTGSQDGRLDLLEIASQSLQNYTSSLKQAITVSGDDATFTNDVTIVGTLNVNRIVTTIESSSVIFSSGSNQLGDEVSDVQIFSGSVYVPNEHYLKGNLVDTDTRINSKLESSWTSSVFLPFSSSVASELVNIVQDALPSSWTGSVFLPFSTSVDERLVAQENFSSSLTFDFTTTTQFNTYTQSTDTRITDLENFSSSLDNDFVSEVEFSSFSSSNDTTITNLSSSISTTDVNQDSRIDVLSSFTGSYATTGSNTFVGSQTINSTLNVSGSSTFTGKVTGNVTSDSTIGGVINLDLTQGNFFDITLASGSNTFTADGITPGMTVIVRLNLPSSGYSTLTFDTSSFQFPRTFQPLASDTANGVDILTFVSFDSNYLYGTINNDFTPVI